MTASTALVVMAHGSREASANADLVALADSIRALQRYSHVVASFLELAEPEIRAACRECVERGATRVVMAPYFLSAGVHMKRDLTAIREEMASQYPGVQFILAEPLGRHPLLAQVVLQRAEEAVEPRQKWTVHRQDDNGNRFVVQTGLSRLEAEQSVADYERLGHKQLYWTEMEHGGG